MSVAYRRPQRWEHPEKDKRQQEARSGLRALGRTGTALRKASYTQKPGGRTYSRHWHKHSGQHSRRACTPPHGPQKGGQAAAREQKELRTNHERRVRADREFLKAC